MADFWTKQNPLPICFVLSCGLFNLFLNKASCLWAFLAKDYQENSYDYNLVHKLHIVCLLLWKNVNSIQRFKFSNQRPTSVKTPQIAQFTWNKINNFIYPDGWQDSHTEFPNSFSTIALLLTETMGVQYLDNLKKLWCLPKSFPQWSPMATAKFDVVH